MSRNGEVTDADRKKQVCDCGCKKRVWHNQLVKVTVKQAIDPTLTKAVTTKVFWVTKECKEPFEQELGWMVILEQYVRASVKSGLVRRMVNARQVMRLQHSIYERNKGFEWARKNAIQSAILFGCPRWMQGYLTKRLVAKAKREKEIEDARPTNIVPIQAEAKETA